MRTNWQTMVNNDNRLLSVYPEPLFVRQDSPPGRIRRHEDGFKRSMLPRCRLCPYTGLRPGEVVNSIKISHSEEEVPIKGELTCQSTNLLNMLWCGKEDRTCPTRDQ